MTLFGGDLLTPAQRQERTLRSALALRVQFWPHEGYLYKSAGDLLLQHGEFRLGRRLPEEYEHLIGGESRCFENALAAVEARPDLRYVEGVFSIGAGHYTPHAWCLEPSGELLEVTLPTDSGEKGKRYGEAGTRLPFLPPDRWGYWGCVFHPDFIRAVWATQEGHVGILDRPKADEGAGQQEWRDDWPVLRLPYDPDRRTLDDGRTQ